MRVAMNSHALPVYKNNRIASLLCIFETIIRVRTKQIFFLFLNQNICCGYSKEPSQWDGSFEHPKHMLKLMDKKIFTILHSKNMFIWTYGFFKLNPFLTNGIYHKTTHNKVGKAHCMYWVVRSYTVKPVLSGYSKIDKRKMLMTNCSLMKVESIAECSPWSILQYFWPALSDNRSWIPVLSSFWATA